MTINDLLNQGVKELKKKKIASAVLDAEVLLSHVLNKSREYLVVNCQKTVTENQIKKFDILLKKRLRQEPVAYLTKQKEFYGLNFYVDRRVLIPRPETEILVETVLEFALKDSKLKIVDAGTGSGCIAIALAKHLPKAEIEAVDISQLALQVAIKNAQKHGVKDRIKFVRSNLLKTIKEPADIIVANLPYLSVNELNKSIKYEPRKALVGKKQGMEYFEKLLMQAAQKLKINGKVFLEIHPPLLKKIQSLIKINFPRAKITVKKDLAKRSRILIIDKKSVT